MTQNTQEGRSRTKEKEIESSQPLRVDVEKTAESRPSPPVEDNGPKLRLVDNVIPSGQGEFGNIYYNETESCAEVVKKLTDELARERAKGENVPQETVNKLEQRINLWNAVLEDAHKEMKRFKKAFNPKAWNKEITEEILEVQDAQINNQKEKEHQMRKVIALRQAEEWLENDFYRTSSLESETPPHSTPETTPKVASEPALEEAPKKPQPQIKVRAASVQPAVGFLDRTRSFFGKLFGSKTRKGGVPETKKTIQIAPSKRRGWLSRISPAIFTIFLQSAEPNRTPTDLTPEPDVASAHADETGTVSVESDADTAEQAQNVETAPEENFIILGDEIQNPWEASQKILEAAAKEAGLNTAQVKKITQNLKSIQDVDTALVRSNNISVPEWNISGERDHTKLPIGTQLDTTNAKQIAKSIVEKIQTE